MRIGSLFSGYGGLDMAVQDALGGELTWVSDIEPGPCAILAHHWPDVPNLGDITATDFTQVEQVDVICGGFPCQDVSHAGRRAGLIRDGEGRTRSGLWGHMLRAIDEQRPRMVVAENVRGLLSAQADSDMEPCPFCMGDDGASPMRALGAVLADLADIGYDAAWTGLRAADVGAPHGRFRVFILAWPTTDPEHDGRHGTEVRRGIRPSQDVGRVQQPQGSPADPGLTLLPSPRTSDTNGPGAHGQGGLDLRTAVRLLPTPAVTDMGVRKTVEEWDDWTDAMRARHGNGNGHGRSLAIEAQRLLPTPRATDGTKGGPNQRGSSGDLMLPSAVQLLPTPTAVTRDRSSEELERRWIDGERGTRGRNLDDLTAHVDWGDYVAAIARWEHVLDRPAPSPTEANLERWERRKAARLNSALPVGMRGSIRFIVDGPPRRLSAAFVEWMMGLPAGHVTGVPGITRNQQLRALGNGVVPQQGAAALRQMLARIDQEVSA